jgi:hypothetical protein
MKIFTYISLIPVAILGLMPALSMTIPIQETKYWAWIVLIFGFLGLSTLFLKINPFVKCFALLGFISIFFTQCPFISKFAYIEMVLCIYLYIICLNIEDWKTVFNALWVLLILNIIVLLAQFLHKDTILNFGLVTNTSALTVGNPMQAKSFLIVLSAILLQDKRIRITRRIAFWSIVSIFILAIVYFFQHRVAFYFGYARGAVWWESFKLSLQHPIIGHGLGMFKVLFQTLAHGGFQREGVWYSAHNYFIQIFFELGVIGVGVSIAYLISLIKKSSGRLLFAIAMVLFTLCVHFPDRQEQVVPLLILFVAYIERKVIKYA